jgi:ABC-type transport system involved in cytochrome c biogenesis permease component
MTFLPVVERELRVAARRKATQWTRFFAALTVIVIGFVLLLGAQRRMSTVQMGQMLFMATSVLGFAFSLVAGVFLTADCLCSERRDGTLGLLFLTDLRGFDVVFGKLVANSVTAVYALMAIVPMLGLPLLLGGTTLGEFVRMALVLGVTLLLSLAAGMLASALCEETRNAMLVSFAVMAALTGGLTLLWFTFEEVLRIRRMEGLLLPSPIGAFMLSRPGRFAFPRVATYYWISMATLAALSLGMLAATCWVLPRLWQARQTVTKGRTRAAARHSALRRWTNAVGAMNPYRWLAMREPFPKALGRCFFVLVAMVWLLFCFLAIGGRRGNRDECFVTCFLITFGLHLIVKGMIAMQASRRFCEDRRSGALELLLVSPVEPWTILDGQWAALRRQFGWLLVMLAAMNVLMVFVMTSGSLTMPVDAIATFSLILLGGAVLLFVDFNAIGWVGMRAALDGRRHHRTVMTTLGRIMLGPWVAVFIFVLLGFAGAIHDDYIAGMFIIWALLSIVLSWGLAVRAKRALSRELRRLASGDAPALGGAARPGLLAVQSEAPRVA